MKLAIRTSDDFVKGETLRDEPVDFRVENHGSIFLVAALTDAAHEWIEDHIPEDAMFFGGKLAVEHRFIEDIVNGMLGDGLVIASER